MFLTFTFRDTGSPARKVCGAGVTIVIAALYALGGSGLELTAGAVAFVGVRSSLLEQAANAIVVSKQMTEILKRFILETFRVEVWQRLANIANKRTSAKLIWKPGSLGRLSSMTSFVTTIRGTRKRRHDPALQTARNPQLLLTIAEWLLMPLWLITLNQFAQE